MSLLQFRLDQRRSGSGARVFIPGEEENRHFSDLLPSAPQSARRKKGAEAAAAVAMANWCILVLLLILLVARASVTGVSGMLFELEAGDIKCFSEELNLNALSLGHYHAVSENPLKMSVRVSSPYGSTVHSQEHVFQGEFSFTANEVGTYTACFQIPEAPKKSRTIIDLDWKTGVAAKDWASIAKRDRIEGMELELRKLEDAIQLIHDNMMYLRAKEEQMRNVNEITNSRMAWFSITSMFICLAVASLQLWHLRTFFERKKLL